MSKKYRDVFGEVIVAPEVLRAFLKFPEPERDSNGNVIYLTEQHHKDRCDVNRIVDRYRNTGLVDHTVEMEGQFGDLSGSDFKAMMDKLVSVRGKFEELPSKVRREFANDPAVYLDFMSNPDNRDRAIALGLIRNDWTPESDGLGEHVKKGDQKVKKAEVKPDGDGAT